MNKEEYLANIQHINNEVATIRRQKINELNSKYSEANKEFDRGDIVKIGEKKLKVIKVTHQQWSEAIPPTIMYCGVKLDDALNIISWVDETYFRYGEKLESEQNER